MHLSAVSEALSDADIVSDSDSKNSLKPLANTAKDGYDAEAELASGEVAEWPNAPVLKTGVV